MLCVLIKIFSHASAKKKTKAYGFQMLHFWGSFWNDIVAVKEHLSGVISSTTDYQRPMENRCSASCADLHRSAIIITMRMLKAPTLGGKNIHSHKVYRDIRLFRFNIHLHQHGFTDNIDHMQHRPRQTRWLKELYFNPFTAPACKIAGLNVARTRLQTVDFPIL